MDNERSRRPAKNAGPDPKATGTDYRRTARLDCVYALAILRARSESPEVLTRLQGERRRRFSYLDQQELEAACGEAGDVE